MIRKEERRGERILIIDIRYKKKDGTKARYRKVRRQADRRGRWGGGLETRPRADEEKLAKSTRNNAQIVLRSVLRFAKAKGDVSEVPSGLPRLKQPEPSILEIPSDDQVAEILRLACPTQHRAFGLTTWLRKGIPVHVVQKMAGHRNLSTTRPLPQGRPGGCGPAPRRSRAGQQRGNGLSRPLTSLAESARKTNCFK
jgi:hypothetical protein